MTTVTLTPAEQAEIDDLKACLDDAIARVDRLIELRRAQLAKRQGRPAA